MSSYRPFIGWSGPADTPSKRTLRRLDLWNKEHVRTLFYQLRTTDIARLVQLSAAELRRRIRRGGLTR